ncbi:helix-turn-helix domain-containing protein [Halobacterium jilantaiense]|uniref:Uncharacterized protein n=1 Tax=Halobacterium jilantaiense TaxID=355548 RepID=A0A1I0P8F9_9EURY|nr:hypothetical protein [Halobacterium jilantaiense]SEW10492.1 hypothetical protein SAMN04487945_1476 [Halobacterium jilantaiense]
MRRSGSWQSAPDDRILEIAAEDEDGIVKVGNLAKHDYVHVGQSQVSRRCSKLADHELLRNVGDGVYIITDEGRAYLEGEYDASSGQFVRDAGEDSSDEQAERSTNGA